MPYEIRESSKGYCVHKQGDSGPALGCHESEIEARQQVKALYSSEATKAIDFSPPETVRSTAAAGLAKRREFGRGGTSIGIARARDLSGGKSISPETAKRMVSFFARHEVDKQGRGFNAGADGYPSNGRIAWELWGGDAGRAWAQKLVRQMEAETLKADGKGYGARAGETIRGNLTRGGDGKFASAGDSAPAAEEEKLPPRRQKLGRSAAARAERKRKVAEAKRQSADAKRQARAAATEQRKRDRAARREAEKKRRAEEAQRKLEANRKEALAKTPLNQEAYDALLAFSKAGDVDEDMARAIAQETGLLTIGSNGELRMNTEGRAFLKALDKGDARAALDAMSRASDRLDREARREMDSEKSTALKHGKHNQATHANRYGRGFKATKAQFRRLSKEDRQRFKAEARRRRDSDPNSESQRNARWEARPMATGPAAMTKREYGEQQKREVIAMYERQLAQAKRGEIRTGPFNEYPSKAAAVRQLTAGLESVREGKPASFAGDHLSYIGAAIRSGQQIPNDVIQDHFSSRQEMLSVFEVNP